MAQTHIEQHDQRQQRCWLMELIEDTLNSKNTNRVLRLLFSLIFERTKIQLLFNFHLDNYRDLWSKYNSVNMLKIDQITKDFPITIHM